MLKRHKSYSGEHETIAGGAIPFSRRSYIRAIVGVAIEGVGQIINRAVTWPTSSLVIKHQRWAQVAAITVLLLNARGQPPAKSQKRTTVRFQRQLDAICTDRRDGRRSIPETLRAAAHTIRLE